MTLPRRIRPETTWLVTRRCTQRQFLLRPDEETTQIFLYCLAEAAMRFDIEVYGYLAMSNHYHAVVHDRSGVLPRFLEHLHKMTAKALNVRWSRWENLWAAEECCATELITKDDVFDKLIYTLGNPVAAHLVDRAIHWPGASSLQLLDSRKLTVRRPAKSFFSDVGTMPKVVGLEIHLPPGEDDAAAWAARVREAIAEVERRAAKERARTGIKVVGRKEVLRRSAFDSPQTHEPRRKLRPAIACRDVARRVKELVALVQFRRRYWQALHAFANGEWRTVFPFGVWGLRRVRIECEVRPSAVPS